MKNLKQYYKELGKMVYAVAMADGAIKTEEVEALHNFVLKELAGNESHIDTSLMNEAFYVNFEFEECIKNHLDTKSAIISYAHFIHGNFETGDETLIQRSVKLLESVAGAYSRTQEEKVVLLIKEEISEISKNILQTK